MGRPAGRGVPDSMTMNGPTHTRRRLRAQTALFVAVILGVVGLSASPAYAVWSILVVDSETGRVAIASAGCVEDVVELGELLPGQGVVASQSAFDRSIITRAAALIKAGRTPEDVLADVTRAIFDPESETRQHAAVSRAGPAATFTGVEPAGLAEEVKVSAAGYDIAVIGDRLAKAGTVSEIVRAFEADIGPVALEDRLMRGLEAGSATGGDVDCNTRTHSQTALAAAIRIAEPDDRPDRLSVDLRVLGVEAGPNPLLELRETYDQWRAENLPDCPGCDLDALAVPEGGTAGAGELSGTELLIGVGTFSLFVLLWLRRRFASRDAAPSPLDPPGRDE